MGNRDTRLRRLDSDQSSVRDAPLLSVVELLIDFVRRDRAVVVVATMLIVFTWGGRLLDFSLSGDDWLFLFPNAAGAIDVNLGIGRWGAWSIHRLLGDASFAPFATTVFAITCLITLGTLLAAVGRLRGRAALTLIVINGVCPLYIEFINFELLHVPEGLGLVLAGVAAAQLSLESKWWRGGVIAGVIVTITLSLYQPTIITFGVAWVGLLVFRTIDHPLDLRWLFGQLKGLLTAAVVGPSLYLLSVPAAQRVTGTAATLVGRYDPSQGYVSRAGIGESLRRTGAIARGLLLNGTATLPSATKVAVGLLVLAAVIVWVCHLRAQQTTWRVIGWFVPLVSALLLVSPYLLWFVRQRPVPRYNVVTPLALGVAVLLTLLVALLWPEHVSPQASSQRIWSMNGVAKICRLFVPALLVGLVVTSAFQVSRAFNGQYLANQRDMALANRILWAIESDPLFTDLSGDVPVGVIGDFQLALPERPFRYEADSFPFSIVGCGIPQCQNRRLANALNLVNVTPLQFLPARGEGLADTLGIDATTIPVWPAAESILMVDGAIVIRAS